MSGDCTVVAGTACRAIVQTLPHAVVLLDETLRVVLANRAASLLLHLPPQRLRGVSITRVIPQANLDLALRDFRDRRPKVFEVSLPSMRGQASITARMIALRLSYWDAFTGATRAARPSASKRPFTLLVLEDISDRVVLEQQLVDTEKQAVIGQLAAGILHEVSNPLSGIGANLAFVRDGLTKSGHTAALQALDLTLEQLEQMRQILGTLSDFTARPAPHYEPADVQEVVRRCLTFIARDAQRRRVQLSVSFAPSPIECEMDVRTIKQVFINLLKNAMEAMPDGGRLDVRTSYDGAHPDGGDAVVIEVADTGVGIPEPDLRKVFRPLFSTKPRGTGLGLSFCRQAVEEHGGEIRLASRAPQAGTVARVSLPVRQSAVAYV